MDFIHLHANLIVLKDYHLRTHHVGHHPFKNPNPQNLKIESSNKKLWGLKWSSSPSSMLKGAYVLQDYNLRPHHVGHHPFQNPNPRNLKIESSKVKTGGLKWSSSPSSMLKGAYVLQDYNLRPHQVDTTPSKKTNSTNPNHKFQNQNL